jgi:hypothetical protein
MDTLMGAFEYVLYKNVRLGKSSTKPILNIKNPNFLNVKNSNFINVKISFLNVKMAGASLLKCSSFSKQAPAELAK